MKRGTRNLWSAALILLIVSGVGYWAWSQNHTQVSPESTGIFSTAEVTFGCNPPQYETGCKLVAWDNSRIIRAEFGFIEYDRYSTSASILPSQDKRHLLLVREYTLTLIDTASLKQGELSQAPKGQAYGIYSGFPSFIPQVKWVTNGQIRVSLFKDGTLESDDGGPPVKPLDTLTIQVD